MVWTRWAVYRSGHQWVFYNIRSPRVRDKDIHKHEANIKPLLSEDPTEAAAIVDRKGKQKIEDSFHDLKIELAFASSTKKIISIHQMDHANWTKINKLKEESRQTRIHKMPENFKNYTLDDVVIMLTKAQREPNKNQEAKEQV